MPVIHKTICRAEIEKERSELESTLASLKAEHQRLQQERSQLQGDVQVCLKAKSHNWLRHQQQSHWNWLPTFDNTRFLLLIMPGLYLLLMSSLGSYGICWEPAKSESGRHTDPGNVAAPLLLPGCFYAC